MVGIAGGFGVGGMRAILGGKRCLIPLHSCIPDGTCSDGVAHVHLRGRHVLCFLGRHVRVLSAEAGAGAGGYEAGG